MFLVITQKEREDKLKDLQKMGTKRAVSSPARLIFVGKMFIDIVVYSRYL